MALLELAKTAIQNLKLDSLLGEGRNAAGGGEAAQRAQAEQGAKNQTETHGATVGQGAIKRTPPPGTPVGQRAINRSQAQGSPVGQGAIKKIPAQSSSAGQGTSWQRATPGAPVGQGAKKKTPAPSTSAGQGTSWQRATPGAPVGQGAIKKTPAPSTSVGQGAIKKTPAPSTSVGQGATRRTGAAEAQAEQGIKIETSSVVASLLNPSALKRAEELKAQLEKGGARKRPFGASEFYSPLGYKKPSPSEIPDEESLLKPLARFSRYSHTGPRVFPNKTATVTKPKEEEPKEESEESESSEEDENWEVTISREQRTVQPASTMVPHGVNPDYPKPMEFLHQARSYSGRSFTRLNRSPSMSSQGSLDSNMANQCWDHRRASALNRIYSSDKREQSDTASGPTPGTSTQSRASSLDRWEPRGRGRGSSQASTSTPPARRPRSPPSHLLMSDYMTPNPYGTLQPELYKQKNSPMFLPLSGDGPSLGRLHVRLRFDHGTCDLVVHIIEADGLVVDEDTGFTEPYVTLEIVPPVDRRERKTHWVPNTPGPYYDEVFKFSVSRDELKDETLVFQIRDHNRFSRFDYIGDVKMELNDIELHPSAEIWSEISRCRKPSEEYQEMLISLSYLPSAERLTVVVLKGRNLYVNPEKGTVDPVVKLSLKVDKERERKRITLPRRGNRNPVWNEAFNFPVTPTSLVDTTVEFVVCDQSHELMVNDTILGCLLVGLAREGRGRHHWQELLAEPRKSVAMWHTLR